MDAPTAEDIRAWSKLDFTELGFSSDPDLQRVIDVAGATFIKITGQDLAAVDPAIEPLVNQAFRGLTEQQALEQQRDYLETLGDFDLIQQFSAGPYSETRRDPGEAFKARLLNAWPWLSNLLWQLLTPTQYDYWIEFFAPQEIPAFAVTEVEWGFYGWSGDYIYGA